VELNYIGGSKKTDEILIKVSKNNEAFWTYDVKEVLEFALTFLRKEYGLKLFELSYRDTNWTYGGNSGTRNKHTHYKLKRLKDIETKSISITLSYLG